MIITTKQLEELRQIFVKSNITPPVDENLQEAGIAILHHSLLKVINESNYSNE